MGRSGKWAPPVIEWSWVQIQQVAIFTFIEFFQKNCYVATTNNIDKTRIIGMVNFIFFKKWSMHT
jgi:hypothetical protein